MFLDFLERNPPEPHRLRCPLRPIRSDPARSPPATRSHGRREWPMPKALTASHGEPHTPCLAVNYGVSRSLCSAHRKQKPSAARPGRSLICPRLNFEPPTRLFEGITVAFKRVSADCPWYVFFAKHVSGTGGCNSDALSGCAASQAAPGGSRRAAVYTLVPKGVLCRKQRPWSLATDGLCVLSTVQALDSAARSLQHQTKTRVTKSDHGSKLQPPGFLELVKRTRRQLIREYARCARRFCRVFKAFVFSFSACFRGLIRVLFSTPTMAAAFV